MKYFEDTKLISPNDEVVVVVVDQGWDATIRVVLGEAFSLLFALLKVEKFGDLRYGEISKCVLPYIVSYQST